MNKKYFIFSAVLTLAAAGVAQELCYKVALGNDYQNHCYRADDNGTVYGNAVPDSYCQYTYKTTLGNDYARHCYRADRNGTAFGESVADSYCQYTFKTALGNDYARHCYRADQSGNVYGNGVADSYCQYTFKTALGNDYARHCYSADQYGNVYGESVSDSYCQGRTCSNVEGCLREMSDKSDFGVEDLLRNADIRQNDSQSSKPSSEPAGTDSAQPFGNNSGLAI